MQDRFKSRIWDYNQSKMIYFDSPWVCKKPYTEGSSFPQYESCPHHHKISEFMYCTGLKDKNGKLIYEGDIIKDLCTGYKYTVVWKKAGFVLKSEYGSYIGIDTLEQEVIGNLYKNSELLKEDING